MARLDGVAPNLSFFSRALIGIPRLVKDEDLNDNDKSFTVPNNVQWLVQSIYVELTSTADVADRQLEVQFQDSEGDVIAMVRAGKEQAASIAGKYMFAPGMPQQSDFFDTTYLPVALPDNIILKEGWTVRVFDNNDAEGDDDMIVQMLVREMDTVTAADFGVITSREDYAASPGVENLTITSTAPTVNVA